MPTPIDPTIAEPSCRYGYPLDELYAMLDGDREQFDTWHTGRTDAICDGRAFNRETGTYEPSGCGPHGHVVFTHNVQRYLRRQRN